MKQTRKRLGDLLVEAGLIKEEQLQTALKEKKPGQKLGEVFLEHGFVTEQQLIEVLEFQLGIPHVSLYRYPFDTKLFTLIPKEVAKKELIIPLRKEGDRLFVAMADPMDFYLLEDLRLSTGFQIETAIATKDDILKAINKHYNSEEGFEDLEATIDNEPVQEETITDQDSPIVRMVNQLISNAVSQKASDIHIDPQETKLVVRYRIDGILHSERTLPKNMQSMLTARIKIMANLDITEHRIPQDGRIKTSMDFRHVDLRVSTLPTVYGEKIVLRILDLASSLNDVNQLGFNKVHLQRFKQLIENPSGIVLITGPTGSGKSSTLYAALNHLNREEVNIITIEDPVEYQLEGINQIQVNPNIGMTFATGLRSILRQDPNIIMVGEIRDKETAEVSIRAALTGHLVLSTIHTNDSLSTITRLLDMGVEPFLVATSISGIIAQRLVRRVCRDCGEEQLPTKREVEIFAKRNMKIDKVFRGRGCSSCNMTGYRGRIAIHEILEINDEMRRVLMNNESFSNMRQLAFKNKTIFLIDDGLYKVKQGITTTEEVLRVANTE
ncbi:ATPase, T2SS/T4P/T4SS family [Bacillus sp. FJAT-49736]|uniref:GspE/PulE family protein n=1 Tax=Bacillus sp. FJAT-49736 TaxID=2833582 RepID=UPI001BCA004B|nr:ATPase, T2SS/T4P/T4SS family [Bacillus sp. FJAT-49736]MBS4173711.1 Flp pilus assembly complex ATPase component TadA [Bacillus sp. FJAT-49736]